THGWSAFAERSTASSQGVLIEAANAGRRGEIVSEVTIASSRKLSGQCRLAFECLAIPFAKCGRSDVGTLTEVQERCARRGKHSHIVIYQNELAELRVIVRGIGPDRGLAESLGLGSGVGIEGWAIDVAATGPEADTAYLVRISFS